MSSARSSIMLAKKFVLKKAFDGFPKLSDFELVEETLPKELKDGGMFFKGISNFPILNIMFFVCFKRYLQKPNG